MRVRFVLAACALLSCAASLAAEPATPAAMVLTDVQRAAAFTAAGFRRQKDGWHGCDDPGAPSYTPGSIDQVADLNGDGRPEAVISEGSTYCFGAAEQGYSIVTEQKDGSWKRIDSGQGIALFLETKGKDGWPDLEVGGPGFCFPVMRWDGAAYQFNRAEYEGKACELD